ncbi:uncharacterized protein NEPG_00495 [Nematocida parisii ERTm1]|uniref:uncharacterized protein n=1 Tax=Nematocida parisii (strain ERTm1 / ATCC PRA-289) TaxID=881290 RepID=UPI000264B20E|nr:uncharacterized protein NEPG_00495 [Nematocida parisii ERTm1]EIJ94970.1 hypothetical protein NEPG_00495 [Nematocida parisii ERTm1]|eukprot:XP_013058326.1 hypothetical protein NEPG_00495 [Nematocida parisii ERTm1]
MCSGCGMKMCIDWSTEVSHYIIPGMYITRTFFPLLVIFIACTTLATNHVKDITNNKYIIDMVKFICSWILMMSMMTGNGFILIAMLLSVITSRIILQKMKKDRSISCC